MNGWLESLQKLAKSMAPGVSDEVLRRAETESGVPLPSELIELYTRFDGGELAGGVTFYSLWSPDDGPSVLEKSRLKLVGLPAAGVWRFGLQGPSRHLFTARKSAMQQQGEVPQVPEWFHRLHDEAWVFGVWDDDKAEMKLFPSMQELMNMLTESAEMTGHASERTFAHAMDAVQGAINALTGGSSEETANPEGMEAPPARTEAPPPAQEAPAPKRRAPAKKARAKGRGAGKAKARTAAKKAAPKRKAGAKKGAAKAKRGAAKAARGGAKRGGAAKKGRTSAGKKGGAAKARRKR